MAIFKFWKNIIMLKLLQEDFEDTKGVIIIRIMEKNRQHNGQMKKVQNDKQWSTKHTHTIKDRLTRIPLKMGGKGKLKLW